jgi:predicted RNA-binding Zn-ribbon protein involved in translation (DUF1610 family)
MGLFDKELKPGHEGLKPCPNCGKQKVGRRYKSDSEETEYYCDNCGYEPTESEAQMSFREALSKSWEKGKREFGTPDDEEIIDPELKQQVKDREAEGWEIEEVTDSGKRVVMSTTKGGTIGGHALTGVLIGIWSFGLGNVAYGKLSKKRNKQRIVLRVDDETNSSEKKSEEDDPIELIRELKQLNDEGLISDTEFEEKRQELLDSV